MDRGIVVGLASVLAWFAFPLVPALLGGFYHQATNWGFGGHGGPDPRDWDWGTWIVQCGPLLGFGFLAGATLDLPDDPDEQGLRRWTSRRWARVSVAPWSGFLGWVAVIMTINLASRAWPAGWRWSLPSLPPGWESTWAGWLLIRVAVVLGIGSVGYAWLFAARAALGTARRLGRFRRTLARGMAVALGFLGSLFGSFWAITEAWRGYFFDPRVMPALVAALTLPLMVGCATTETYGEVRRRELFQAMLTAWLLGLALAWRWWSRPRSKPPGGA